MLAKLKSKKIKLLKDYFKKNPLVIMAFVFGSQAQKLERKISDWDIAIWLKEKNLKISAEVSEMS